MFVVRIKENRFMIMGVSEEDIEKAKNSRSFSNVEVFNKVDADGNVVDTIMELNSTARNAYNVKKIFEKTNAPKDELDKLADECKVRRDTLKKVIYNAVSAATINKIKKTVSEERFEEIKKEALELINK